jgi:hypothetical protein
MEEKQGYYTMHNFLITSEISSRHICVALTAHATDITTTKCLTRLFFISVYKWNFLPHSLTHSLSLCWQWNIQKKTFECGGTGIIKEIKILLWKPGYRVHGRLSNRRPYFIPTPQRKMLRIWRNKTHCFCKLSQSAWSSRGNVLTYRPRICVNPFPLDLRYTNLATVQQNTHYRN